MQTIETKYLGPTDHRGARIKATASNGDAVTIPYPHDETDTGKHFAAVRKLAAKLDWSGELIGGHTARGMVWIFTDKASPRIELPRWGLTDQGLRAWLTSRGTVDNLDAPLAFDSRRAALEYRKRMMRDKPDAARLQPAELPA